MKLFSLSLIVLVFIFNEHILYSDAKSMTDSGTVSEIINKKTRLLRNINRSEEITNLIQISDPFEFDRYEFNLPGEILNFKININSGSISGLSNIQFLDLNVSSVQPTVKFNILFPYLKFYAEHYELDGNLYYVVPLRGNGIAQIEVISLQIWGTLYLKNSTINNGILLDKLENTALKVEQIVSKIDFDLNIDDIVSKLVGDLLADYINRFNKYFIAAYSDTIVKYINDLLYDLE